jgi:hypothetical protein
VLESNHNQPPTPNRTRKNNTRQLTLTARLWAGGMHAVNARAEAHATTTEHQRGNNGESPLLLTVNQPTEWLSDAQTPAASRLCVGKRWSGRIDTEDKR